MPEIFNRAIEAARFSMKGVYGHVIAIEEYKNINDALLDRYSQKELSWIFSAIIRFAYLLSQ